LEDFEGPIFLSLSWLSNLEESQPDPPDLQEISEESRLTLLMSDSLEKIGQLLM